MEILVHGLMQSHIVYCNSLFLGISKRLIFKLKRVQNSAARLIMGVSKYEHISPILFQLHWLPVEHRINFKILIIVYKSLHNMAPEYIKDMLSIRETNYILRSNARTILSQPIFKLALVNNRHFSAIGPRLWNQLPDFCS